MGPAAVVPTRRQSSRVVRRPALGRGPARRDPTCTPGPDRPRPQPVPHVGRDVGCLGGLCSEGRGLLRQGEAQRLQRRNGAERGDQLRRLPIADRAIHQVGRRRGVVVGVLRPDGRDVLPDRRHDDRGRLAGRAWQPDRQGRPGLRADRRIERGEWLRVDRLQAREPPAHGGQARDDDDRPEPLAATPDRAHDLPERPPRDQRHPAGRRPGLGPREDVRAARRRSHWRAHRPRSATQARRPGERSGLQGAGHRGHPGQQPARLGQPGDDRHFARRARRKLPRLERRPWSCRQPGDWPALPV